MMTGAILGLDVGGANLKGAHSRGEARSHPYALWRAPDRLAEEVRHFVARFPDFDVLALTMTGELCDCWESNRDGVHAILDAVATVAGERSVRVWTHRGTFVDPDQARAAPGAVASANWLALACYAGRFAPTGAALLIDLGTTTTDLVGLVDGTPRPRGRTDPERLTSGELVYLGWRRTPLCALLDSPSAAEFFATTHDAYLVLGDVPDQPEDLDTADGRPATRACASRRLARMVCADLETTTAQERHALAERIDSLLADRIGRAATEVLARSPERPQTILTSGSGEFLVPRLLRSPAWPPRARDLPVISLRERMGPAISAAACAHAVAQLCLEREG